MAESRKGYGTISPVFGLMEKVLPVQTALVFARRVEGAFELQYDLGSLLRFKSEMNRGRFGIIASNHQSHIDPLGYFRALRKAKILDGSLIIVAKSFLEGQQELPNRYFKLLEEYIKNSGVEFVGVVREKDEREYGMQRTGNTGTIRNIVKAGEQGRPVIILPEGTTTGGKFDTNGHQYGIQKVEDEALPVMLAKYMYEHGRGFVILPCAVNGSQNIYNTVTGKPGEECFRELKKIRPSNKTFATTRMGKPFTEEDYKIYLKQQGYLKDLDDDKTLIRLLLRRTDVFFDYLMGVNIAPMLPEEAQGYYLPIVRNATSLESNSPFPR